MALLQVISFPLLVNQGGSSCGYDRTVIEVEAFGSVLIAVIVNFRR
jgi:hypothetical protein